MSGLWVVTKQRKKDAARLANEGVREARLEQKRVHAQTVRKEKTHEATASRLERKREHARVVRAAESPEARTSRLECIRACIDCTY